MISFHFSLSFDSAMILLSLEKWSEKYTDKQLEKEWYNHKGPAVTNLLKDLQKSSQFLRQARSLRRQGFVVAKGWELTPKGHGMCEVVRCEIKEAGSFSKKIGTKFMNAIEATGK